MNYVLTNDEMRRADGYTIEKLGVPSLTLMERAGLALANEAERLAPKGEILCVCGGGNNGGDGFVCARILKARGRQTDIVCFAQKTSADCLAMQKKWLEGGGEILSEFPEEEYALVIDCLFGTGFHGRLTGKEEGFALQINLLKGKGAKVLSADIPSGVNGANGRVDGVAVRADVTLCLGELKIGALAGDGLDYAGACKRADIGIVLPDGEYYRLVDREEVGLLLPKRRRNSHKGSYGRAAIVAGSAEYTGAAYLSAAAYLAAAGCLRAGAGYTTLFLPKDILPYYILKLPEILLCESNEGGRYAFNEEIMRKLLSYDSVAFGMGMGASQEVCRGVEWLLSHYEGRLILDADGLNSLAAYGEPYVAFAAKKCDVLVTPHAKEFSRLSGYTMEEIAKEGGRLAVEFAKKTGANVLLKNALTVITDGKEKVLNSTGCSGQAKGGSGDVLSGVLAALCAQGANTLQAAKIGAYLTGKAAELAAAQIGEYSLTASDVIAYLGRAFLFVTENADTDGED